MQVSVPATAVAVCCAASYAAVRVFAGNMGRISCTYRVDFSPRTRAFAIWLPIYAASLASALLVAFGADGFAGHVEDAVLWLWAAAWAGTALWSVAFGRIERDPENAPWYFAASAVSLLVSAACSGVAVYVLNAWSDVRNVVAGRAFVQFSISLLSGWLLCASVLNLALLDEALRGARRPVVRLRARRARDQPLDETSEIVVVLVALLAACLALLLRAPFYVLGAETFVLFQRGRWRSYRVAGTAALALSAFLVFARATFR